MRTLPLYIATTVLVAICEGKVHVIFSWSSKGTHIAPLETNGIHASFLVISYPGHFVPKSFRTHSFLAFLDID